MSHNKATRYRANLQDEVDSSALYRGLAQFESNPQLAEVYRRLAAAEEHHAEFWEKRLAALGEPVPGRRPSWRTRALIWLARHWGANIVLPVAGSLEARDRAHYDHQPETHATPMPAQERSHARVLRAMQHRPATRGNGGLEGSVLARLEGRHSGVGGNALRAAVLGANDGLVSNLSLVMGAAGAAFSQQALLITGLAGLVAGACSMALGEWLSVQSSRELYEREIRTEAEELAEVPEEEKEELVLIYRSKGLSEGEAHAIADRVMANPDTALDTLAREELGIDPEELGGSPWTAAAASFLLFSAGAIVPVLPFFVAGGAGAVAASAGLSAVALFVIGAAITLLTGRSVLFSGMRQLLIGLAAAALTYGVGHLLGVSLSG
jgi:VIT1/CCC1 family predicted Fe2+/Mn2+ transporter